MPWHRVIIKNSEEAHLLVQGLMIPFMQHYKEAGRPEEVSVYLHRDDFGNRTYYFSANASSMAKDLLHTFQAMRCFGEPNLESFRKIRL
jgi:hypothetical protein